MSIAFEMSTGDRIQRPGFRRGNSAFKSPEQAIRLSDRRMTAAEESSSSSSIGRNSDSGSGGGDGDSGDGDGEVQSEYKGPLDCLDALEEVLPIKKGVSKFYNGKSKSFTSLADVVSCSSIKEIVKPENALTRKRKNLLAHATYFDKIRDFPPRDSSASVSKKPTNSNRSTSTISSNESNNSESSNASSPVFTRPPLHPQSRKSLNAESSSSPHHRHFSPWRSLSLSDLHGAAAATTTTTLDLNKNEEKKGSH